MLDVNTSNGADADVGIDLRKGLTADTVTVIEIDTPPSSSSCYSNNFFAPGFQANRPCERPLCLNTGNRLYASEGQMWTSLVAETYWVKLD